MHGNLIESCLVSSEMRAAIPSHPQFQATKTIVMKKNHYEKSKFQYMSTKQKSGVGAKITSTRQGDRL